MNDFLPPAPAPAVWVDLFSTPAHLIVQSPEQSHEYKKSSGSSDAAHTYDTTAR
ncbi:hypothetical protein [Nocardiopsis sp. JB363]|uniref:hypothetical protein n=1 Tax=Nocardiopsis sp. JB363 TaxID=1434837 RepID=UPI000979E64A|nr:hypothetical protein [Nocardiopsis sp. JB363]SIO89002.1 hypothetical protein BQ8420_20425 [Nocardiopsis sp. JB363]